MDINKITELLDTNQHSILSLNNRAERLDAVISLIVKRFPPVSHQQAIYGPITSMTGYQDYVESQLIIEDLRKLKAYPNDVILIREKGDDLADIVEYINKFIS